MAADISERTKVALAAAKQRGKRLGNPNLPDAAKRGTAAVKANARRFAANVRPIIDEIIAAAQPATTPSLPNLTSEMFARRGAGHGRMCSRGDPSPFRRRRGRKRAPYSQVTMQGGTGWDFVHRRSIRACFGLWCGIRRKADRDSDARRTAIR
jgi:hypothetical protein